MITNATKNLGIGLYPYRPLLEMEAAVRRWKYTSPSPFPFSKQNCPICPGWWKLDDETDLPVKDESGAYIAPKLPGMKGTQADA